jgi:hypothetical protein
MWTMVVIAMALAYLRQIDSPEVFAEGAVAVVAAIAAGIVVGWPVGKWRDTTYWSLIVATAAFLSVAAEDSHGAPFRAAWSATGIAVGTFCGIPAARKFAYRALLGACAGGLTMYLFARSWDFGSVEVRFDLICAPIIGALVALLIEMVLWTERKRGLPRYLTASWLLLAVVVGNMAVPLVV